MRAWVIEIGHFLLAAGVGVLLTAVLRSTFALERIEKLLSQILQEMQRSRQ